MASLDTQTNRDSRMEAVALSLQSLALEGGQLDSGMIALAAEYIDGVIDADELINRTRIRCGLPPLPNAE